MRVLHEVVTQDQNWPQGGDWVPACGMEAVARRICMPYELPGADLRRSRSPSSGWAPLAVLVMAFAAGCDDAAGPPEEVSCQESAEGFPCDRVYLLSHLTVAELGGDESTRLNDIWGWVDPETRREYALVGRTDGTAFVDVTDPERAVYLGVLPMHAGAVAGIWRDIKVYRDHAFIVADGSGNHGLQVFDLAQLRGVTGAPVTFQETAHYPGVASAHNVAINEASGFAYVVGANGGGETCGGGLHMLDIRDPLHPVFAGCYSDSTTGRSNTGYVHDTQCVAYHGPDVKYQGREVCFTASETAIGIVDVSDKAHPLGIATAAYPGTAYTHQGWLSEDQAYFYLDDELDELQKTETRTRTLVWDMRSLDEPVLVREFLGSTPATDHNQFVRGQHVFQANYASGLRVLDIGEPMQPREVGYFDTFTESDEPGFVGAWGNYPFLPSGTIVVSSIREGLFVLRFRP